jgi:hypothetical protein
MYKYTKNVMCPMATDATDSLYKKIKKNPYKL